MAEGFKSEKFDMKGTHMNELERLAKREEDERWAQIHFVHAAMIIVVLILVVAIMAAVGMGATRPAPLEPNDIPGEYDPNLCDGDVMDWAFCSPASSILYAVEFWSKSGRPVTGLDLTLGGGPIIDFSSVYEGKMKDPNGGWFHRWYLGYTPAAEGVHYLNIKASYGPRTHSEAWRLDSEPPQMDTRTVLLFVFSDDTPFLRPSSEPAPVAKMKSAQRAWQKFAKTGRRLPGPVRVFP